MSTTKKYITDVIIVAALIVAVLLKGGLKNISKGLSYASKNQISTSTAISKNYTFVDGTFTFAYPGDFTFTILDGGDSSGNPAQTALFKGNNSDRNFQVYVADYTTTEPITIVQLHKDLPGLLIEEAQPIAVDKSVGVAFISGDKNGTFRTREIWFSHGGKIYQISTVKAFDEQMVDILATWKWQ